MKNFFFLITILCITLTLSIVGCTTTSGVVVQPPKSDAPEIGGTAEPVPEPIQVQVTSLAWDTKPERKEWTAALMKAIDTNWGDLQKATDMNQLCAKYTTLNEAEKKKAFGELFVAVAYYESAWKPDTRYFEKTMGYYSEGLFQLSVVDEEWAKCGLTKENILQPVPNINCGVAIMARQIRNKSEILVSRGVYWAVIKEGGKYQKINEIKTRIVNAMPKCKGA